MYRRRPPGADLETDDETTDFAREPETLRIGSFPNLRRKRSSNGSKRRGEERESTFRLPAETDRIEHVRRAFAAMAVRPRCRAELDTLYDFRCAPSGENARATQFALGLERNRREFPEEKERAFSTGCSGADSFAFSCPRAREIGWMHSVCLRLSTDFESLFLARSLFDRVASTSHRRRFASTRELSAACLWVATKGTTDDALIPFGAPELLELAELDASVEDLYAAERRCLLALDHRLGLVAFRERQALAVLHASAMPYVDNRPDVAELARELTAAHPEFGCDREGTPFAKPSRVVSYAAFLLSKMLSELALFDEELNPPRTSPLAVALGCVAWALECVGVPKSRWSCDCLEVRHFAAVLSPGELERALRRIVELHRAFLFRPIGGVCAADSVGRKFLGVGFLRVAEFIPGRFR